MIIRGNTLISELMHGYSEMTPNDAYRILSDDRKDLIIRSCVEYDECFTFQAVPKSNANDKDLDSMFDSLYRVDKATSKCYSFNPLDLSPEEYQRGRQITDFK